MSAPGLILASRSPRRAQLLRQWGYRFEQADPPLDDPAHPQADDSQSPTELAMQLAAAKARSFPPDLFRDKVVLAADTLIVHHDGALAGTPQTRQQAEAMIRRFINRRHVVITGVATVSPRGLQCLADSAQVDMGELAERQLADYLAGDDWQGKAGGYNLFDRQTAGWPLRVHGDPTTVVGLPMRLLAEHLDRLGVARQVGQKTS